jgi:hypothetical protein
MPSMLASAPPRMSSGVAACASMAHAGSLRNEGVVKDDRLLDSEADEGRDLASRSASRKAG